MGKVGSHVQRNQSRLSVEEEKESKGKVLHKGRDIREQSLIEKAPPAEGVQTLGKRTGGNNVRGAK